MTGSWTPYQGSIRFEGNGGTGQMDSMENVFYTSTEKLPSNQFTYTGYTFKGWSRDPEGEVQFQDKAPVTGLIQQDGEEIILYALWDANPYEVQFDGNGGEGQMENQKFIYDTTAKLRPNLFTKKGYSFDKWEAEDGKQYQDMEEVKNLTSEKNGIVVLKALWVKNLEQLNHVPVITGAEDKVLTVGDSFAPLSGVSAYDEEDGEIKLTEANVIANDVDTSRAGEYSVTYEVTDSQGASVRKLINVVVNPKQEVLNHVPVITGAEDKVLTVGDSFDPLSGVSAYDEEDGEIKLTEANVIANDVDTSRAGEYSVTYEVTDSQGASVRKLINVVVNPKQEVLNHVPVITGAEDKVLTVGDNFDPLSGVSAYDEEDGDLTKYIKVIVNTVDTTKPGNYKVTYSVKDSAGNQVKKSIRVKVTKKTEESIEKPTEKPGSQESQNSESPKTGDEANMRFWFIVGVSSMLSLLMLAKRKYQRQ